MSKNRLKKIQIGEKEFVVSPKKHVNYVAQEKREALMRARKDDFAKAGRFFQQFKRALFATPTRADELAGRFLALRDRIRKEIRSKRVRILCLQMLDDAIRKAEVIYGIPTLPPEEWK